ncbi:LysR family transcriptional regulator [Yinghuangia soli]|uniref:LysR family transcriptional regulator n=1 Tax=Yinghuangia soli TaxID=2908204 RepID=A0AA41PV42_9ACTN|nr:LysR family transcriptional regulator [Yinghuangia soli]MCF2525771.1 LysR family transcriptional regulator [Yinghuangia soli]
MERAEMEIFLTLAEELHFGRTATRLHISPALVSQTVKKIERRLGVELFERTSRRVELTEVGAELRDNLLPHRQGIQQALHRAAMAGRGIIGTVTAGFMGTQAGRLIFAARDRFEARYPGCQVRVVETQLYHHLSQLHDGSADVVLLPMPIDEPGISVGPVLTREPRYIGVAPGHRLAGHVSVSLEDLAGERFATLADSVPRYWADYQLPTHTPSGRLIGRTTEVITTYPEYLALVAAGRAIAMGDSQLPLLYQRPDVVFVPIRDMYPMEHALAWRTDKGGDKRIRAFVDIVTEATPEVTGCPVADVAADEPQDAAAAGPASA